MINRWDPFREMSVLQDRVNRLFNEQQLSRTETESASNRAWAPVVDILENDSELIVVAELPGVDKNEVEIEASSDSLTIKGERKFPEDKKGECIRMERPYGHFMRSFTIGVPVQPDKIKASYKDGVLEITVPKAEELKPKKIEISSE